MSTFVVKKVNTGIMFNLKADNGQVIATSEVYTTAASCENGIQSVRENAPVAEMVRGISDIWERPFPSGRWRFFVGARGWIAGGGGENAGGIKCLHLYCPVQHQNESSCQCMT